MYGRVILSALLFSIPFLFPAYFGFFILFFWVPLIKIFDKNVLLQYTSPTATKLIQVGFLWGIIAYGIHFIWLLDLLIKKSNATLLFSVFIYSFIVFYAALTSAIWFFFLSLCYSIRMGLVGATSGATASVLYFFLLDRYMFWFLEGRLSGGLSGYPFLNPLIPLMQYKKMFVFVLSIIGCKVPEVFFMPQNRVVKLCGREFVYIEPTKNAFEICKNLHSTEALAPGKENLIFVGPETTLQFPLNKKKSLVRLWCDVAPPGSSILLGSLREAVAPKKKKSVAVRDTYCNNKIKQFQTIYHLRQGLIIAYYDKRLLVPFSEKIPKWWRGWSWAGDLFLKNQYPISRGRGSEIFNLPYRVRPLVCSELFEMSRGEICAQDSDLLIAFVNDSWFCPYFRKIMVLGAAFKSWWCGKTLLYVGHP
jgi:apolipoprotein N-acyltransferase